MTEKKRSQNHWSYLFSLQVSLLKQIQGWLQERKVLVLIDSDASHNFISAHLVAELGLEVDKLFLIRLVWEMVIRKLLVAFVKT